jgi:hypothetical protein
MNKELDFLLRMNKGKNRIQAYENVFITSGFKISELKQVPLEVSDKILEQTEEVFSKLERKSELIESSSNFIDSDLLREIYLKLNPHSTSYIFTDDIQYCGLFIINAKRGLELALNVAINDYQNTCFLLDTNLKYSFTINHNDEDHPDHPNTFDIQLCLNDKETVKRTVLKF